MPRPLMVDVTTLLAEAGRIAHGTTRVERGIVGALLEPRPDRRLFCRFSPSRQRFQTVAAETVRSALMRPDRAEVARIARPSEVAARVSSGGRRLEYAIRSRMRDPLLARVRQIQNRLLPPRLPDRATVLAVGELRFNLPLLADMVMRSGGAFVPVIFDVLPIGFVRGGDVSGPRAEMAAAFDLLFRTARLCLCISEVTARTVAEYARLRGFAAPACAVVRLADELPAPPVTRPPEVPVEPGRYVLSVGMIVGRKNQSLLVDVWRSFRADGFHPDCQLVLAGAVHADSYRLVEDIRSDPELSRRIVILENADDRTLAWLYANCRFTAFPSLLEGFGLPVAESLAMGKLCVASSASAVPEAARGQGILLDPTDRAAWRTTLSHLIGDDTALRAAEATIAANYRPQSWRDTADGILALLAADGPR